MARRCGWHVCPRSLDHDLVVSRRRRSDWLQSEKRPSLGRVRVTHGHGEAMACRAHQRWARPRLWCGGTWTSGFRCARSRGVRVRAEVRNRSTKGYAPAARSATSLRGSGLENARCGEARPGLEPARVGVRGVRGHGAMDGHAGGQKARRRRRAPGERGGNPLFSLRVD